MGLFKKKKQASPPIDDEAKHDALPSSGDIHDPILTAVREQQPWEANANQAQTQSLTPSGALRDVFGNPIMNPDISNPARAREERPLDTIRTFEFSMTGDERIREAMETQRLGFRPRQDFTSMPHYQTNPYDNGNNVISFGDPNAVADESNDIYFPPPTVPQETGKKKKGGMFRRNKNKKQQQQQQEEVV